MSSKLNLPNNPTTTANMTGELKDFNALSITFPRTTVGNLIYPLAGSYPSGLTYNTATYAGGLYANQGQQGMFLILQDALTNYLVFANDFNTKPDYSDPVLTSFKNKIINGNFSVNQRVVSGTVVLGAGVYGHDRWKAGASGCTYTFATTANNTVITITAGSLRQIIEGNNLQSGTHTLSWVGTAQGKINGGAYSATGVTGTATGGTDLTVEFNTGTLSKVQIEAGGNASNFEQRLFSVELMLCERYFEKSFNYSVAPAQNTGSSGAYFFAQIAGASSVQAMGWVGYKVTKRVSSPTITGYNPNASNTNVYNASVAVSFTSTSIATSNDNGFGIFATSPPGSSSGNLCYWHWTSDAEI